MAMYLLSLTDHIARKKQRMRNGKQQQKQRWYEQNNCALNDVFLHITFLALGARSDILREYLKVQNTEQRAILST